MDNSSNQIDFMTREAKHIREAKASVAQFFAEDDLEEGKEQGEQQELEEGNDWEPDLEDEEKQDEVGGPMGGPREMMPPELMEQIQKMNADFDAEMQALGITVAPAWNEPEATFKSYRKGVTFTRKQGRGHSNDGTPVSVAVNLDPNTIVEIQETVSNDTAGGEQTSKKKKKRRKRKKKKKKK